MEPNASPSWSGKTGAAPQAENSNSRPAPPFGPPTHPHLYHTCFAVVWGRTRPAASRGLARPSTHARVVRISSIARGGRAGVHARILHVVGLVCWGNAVARRQSRALGRFARPVLVKLLLRWHRPHRYSDFPSRLFRRTRDGGIDPPAQRERVCTLVHRVLGL